MGIIVVGSCPGVELSWWRAVMMGSFPDGESSWWVVVLVENCVGGELPGGNPPVGSCPNG